MKHPVRAGRMAPRQGETQQAGHRYRNTRPSKTIMSTSHATTDFIERLESKIAYLEQANGDLSDVVYRQQRQIDELRAELLALSGRMAAALAEPTAYTPEQEKPPHY
jgi:uncharacterized coiled-coil protein SlyX